MKTLTDEQAEMLFAFLVSFELHATGAWPAIENTLREEFGIPDPERELEAAKAALLD